MGGTEEWVSQKETNKMKQAKMERLNKIQDDEYFRKTLFATNLTAASKYKLNKSKYIYNNEP